MPPDSSTRQRELYDITNDALRLWRHVFGDRPDLIELFSGYRRERSDKARLDMPAARHYHVGELADAWAWAAQQDSINRDVYFCCHQLLAPQRIKDNAASVLALWCDVDAANLNASPIQPTAIVESSPGRLQAFARLSRPIPPLVAEALNKRWALSFGADPSGFDLTQLLRVPGTHNYKYAAVPLVRLLHLDGDV